MKQLIRELQSVEERFFVIGDGVAHIRGHFSTFDEIFDESADTKIPRLNADFIEWIEQSFDYVPNRCKLDFEIMLDDPGNNTVKELEEFSRANILLELKAYAARKKRENGIALSLCVSGLLMILLSILINRLWNSEGTIKEIVTYVLDILATVPFWGAADIYFVENRTSRYRVMNYIRRFRKICFQSSE